MSQMTSTAKPMRKAAMTPATRERKAIAWMNVSMERRMACWRDDERTIDGRRVGRARLLPTPRAILFHRECFVDQLLTVRHVLGEFGVRALLGDLDPGLILRVVQRDDLDVVIAECLDRFLVHVVGLRFVIGLRLLARLYHGVLLLLVQLLEALFRHQ